MELSSENYFLIISYKKKQTVFTNLDSYMIKAYGQEGEFK